MGKAERAIKKIKTAFPKISGICLEKVKGKTKDMDIIFLGDAAEGGTIDGMPAADYYDEYGYRVHKKLTRLLSMLGYEVEWFDPGTIYAYPE